MNLFIRSWWMCSIIRLSTWTNFGWERVDPTLNRQPQSCLHSKQGVLENDHHQWSFFSCFGWPHGSCLLVCLYFELLPIDYLVLLLCCCLFASMYLELCCFVPYLLTLQTYFYRFNPMIQESAKLAGFQAVTLALEDSLTINGPHQHIFADSWAIANGVHSGPPIKLL